MNNSHQQSSKENMKTSVKTQETHLESKKRWDVAEIPAKGKFEEEENGDGEKKREEEEMCRNLSLLHSFNWFK